MKNFNRLIGGVLVSLSFFHPLTVFALEKTETVYSTLNFNGGVQSSVVHTELKDISAGDVVDYTRLSEIKNISGKEKFSRESEKLTWKSTGRDIVYQGKIKDSLPISVSLGYQLDGVAMAPSKMIGKKGHVVITFDFINHDYNESYGMYVPYVVDTTLILSNDVNSNISISNGRVVSTGTKSILTSLAAPGLYQSTGMEEFHDFDRVILSYDTEKFQKSDVYFVATPKLLESVDVDKINELENEVSNIRTLQDGMNKIEDGAQKLGEGMSVLSEEAELLSDKLSLLAEGQNSLNYNIQEINSKITDVSNTLMVLNDMIENASLNSLTLTEEDYSLLPESVRDTLTSLIGVYQNDQNMVISLREFNASLKSTYDLYGLGDGDTAEVEARLRASGEGEREIALLLNTKKLYEVNYDVNLEIIEDLVSNMKNILTGENGILSTVRYYLEMVRDSSNRLASGSQTITDGLNGISVGAGRLSAALLAVNESTHTLSSGVSQINQDGIHKISDIGTKAEEYAKNAKNLVELSKEYHGFASSNANQTVFIYKLTMK